MVNRLTKICRVCGREFQWRKKWKDNWHQVKYCSHACKKSGLSDIDHQLEKGVMDLLRSRKKGSSICPSEVVRKLFGEENEQQWQLMMEPIRNAARRLAHQGKIGIMQGRKTVDPSRFKGPIRLKLRK